MSWQYIVRVRQCHDRISSVWDSVMTVYRPCETVLWQFHVSVTCIVLAVKHRLTLTLYSHNTSPHDCFIASTLFHTETFLSLQCLRPKLYFHNTLTQMPKLTLMYFLIWRYPAETLSDIEVRLQKHALTLKLRAYCHYTAMYWQHSAGTMTRSEAILPHTDATAGSLPLTDTLVSRHRLAQIQHSRWTALHFR